LKRRPRVFAPKGQPQISPGQRPGTIATHSPVPVRAQHRQPLVPDFRGLFSAGIPIPRALPGADLFSPFGAKSKTAQHQKPRAAVITRASRAGSQSPLSSTVRRAVVHRFRNERTAGRRSVGTAGCRFPGSPGPLERHGDVLSAGRNRFDFAVLEAGGLDLDRITPFPESGEAELP
jgi:hypothetical protein